MCCDNMLLLSVEVVCRAYPPLLLLRLGRRCRPHDGTRIDVTGSTAAASSSANRRVRLLDMISAIEDNIVSANFCRPRH